MNRISPNDLWKLIPDGCQKRFEYRKTLPGKDSKTMGVYIVWDQKEKQKRVLKINLNHRRRESVFFRILEESKIPRSPYVIQPLEIHPLSNGSDSNEQGEMLLFPYLRNGDLFNLVYDNSVENLGESRIRQLFRGILLGVKYLHQHQIVHLDLKLENILLDDEFRPVLCDLELSFQLPSDVLEMKPPRGGGTKDYLAPEMSHFGIASYATDVWGLGEVLGAMMTHIPLHPSGNYSWIKYDRLYRGNIRDPITGKLEWSPHLVKLISQMLRIDPHYRLTISQLEVHPWVRTVDPCFPVNNDGKPKDLMNRLTPDLKKRKDSPVDNRSQSSPSAPS